MTSSTLSIHYTIVRAQSLAPGDRCSEHGVRVLEAGTGGDDKTP